MFLNLLNWEKVYFILFHPWWSIWRVLFVGFCKYWGVSDLEWCNFWKCPCILFLWRNCIMRLFLYHLCVYFFLISSKSRFREDVKIILLYLQWYFRELSASWVKKGHFLLLCRSIKIGIKKIFAFQRLYKLIVVIMKSLIFQFPEIGFFFVLSQFFFEGSDGKFRIFILELQHSFKI